MTTQAKIGTDLEWAWLAGFFDGEGWISLGYQFHKKQDKHYWVLQIGISNTHAPTMKRVMEIAGEYGTALYPHHRKKPDGSGSRYRRAAWKWSIAAKKAELFLARLEPYLVTKKEQAEIALAAMIILHQPRPRRTGRGGSTSLPDDSHDKMIWLKKQLHDLHTQEFEEEPR